MEDPMLKVKLSLALCAVVALAACDGRSKKEPFQKGVRKGLQTSEWSKGVVATDNNGCMRLDNLSKFINDAKAELLSIHLSDADFVTLKNDKIEIKQVERRPEASSRNKPSTTVINTTTTTRTRLTFPEIKGDFDPAKLKYFFGGKVVPFLALTTPASKLRESTDDALLLNASSQNGCQTVTFLTAKGERVAEVIDYTRNSIKVQLAEEIRMYSLLPNDNVMVTIVSPATDLDRCGDATLLANTRVLRSYIVAKSRKMERFNISGNLAHLYRYIYDAPELSRTLTPAQAEAAKANKAKRNTSGVIVSLSGSTLEFLANQYVGKDQKVRGQEFTCSRAVITRNN
jgi:hypothetical protein